MTKKLEYAEPVYYCEIAKAVQYKYKNLINSECLYSPDPDCRRCDYRKNFDKNPNRKGILIEYRTGGNVKGNDI